ncbi:MAG: hypothetical protein LBG82_07220 [Clostridiales Family XIII bacterium]|jgi:4-diphosphocytidyl-2-C-methyl-D-erythritol kinase|nr:hypothetical protein [Clostridiales Family XIII bacterium]
MNYVSVRAFAKINHFLKIVGVREDGYHLIRSHMQAVSLCDDVRVELAEAGRGGDTRVDVEMETPARCGQPLPQGEGNIAHRAAGLALRLWGSLGGGRVLEDEPVEPCEQVKPGGVGGQGWHVRVAITKRIPMAAGMAGGSADAAATMLALAKMMAPQLPLKDIMKAGARIGADVPFCMAAIARRETALGYGPDSGAGTSFICEGIGDVMSKAAPVRGFAVLVKPDIEVSTPRVYGAWDSMARGDAAGTDGAGVDAAGDSGGADAAGGAGGAEAAGAVGANAVGTEQANDLERPALWLFPRIGDIMDEVKGLAGFAGADADKANAGAGEGGGAGASAPSRVFMTGSGPTIVALYDDESDAASGYERIAQAYKNRTDINAVFQVELLR